MALLIVTIEYTPANNIYPGIAGPGGYTLINGNVTVSGTWFFIPFTIPSSAFNINLSGSFSVIGEGTIRVIVVNSTNFGLPTGNDSGVTSAIYDSGQVPSGHFNVTLAPTLAPNSTYFLWYVNYIPLGPGMEYSTQTTIVDTDVNLSFLTYGSTI